MIPTFNTAQLILLSLGAVPVWVGGRNKSNTKRGTGRIHLQGKAK